MKIYNSRLYSHTWYIGIRESKKGSILTDKQSQFKVQKNPMNYWCADPLIFCNDGKTYIFAEMYSYIRQRGIIGVCEYKDKKISKWKPVLIEPFHLSYPFVFKIDNDIYMLPESGSVNELRVYKAEKFPYEWKLVKTLAHGRNLVDTTLYEAGNLLTGYTLEMGRNSQSYSIDIDKNFSSVHLVQEKGSNVDTFRNGGQIFKYGNKLIRVCQDCVEVYGHGLIFRELNNDNTFTEIDHIMPKDLNLDLSILVAGIHTYCATEEIEVIDVRTRTFNVLNLIFRILKKLTTCIKVET